MFSAGGSRYHRARACARRGELLTSVAPVDIFPQPPKGLSERSSSMVLFGAVRCGSSPIGAIRRCSTPIGVVLRRYGTEHAKRTRVFYQRILVGFCWQQMGRVQLVLRGDSKRAKTIRICNIGQRKLCLVIADGSMDGWMDCHGRGWTVGCCVPEFRVELILNLNSSSHQSFCLLRVIGRSLAP